VVSPSSSDPKGVAGQAPDAFALLGLVPEFDIDADRLERAFFEKSKESHPDRFANAPANERVIALSRARALNDAYQLLKKPASRAEYLLAREGITIGDNERIDPILVMDVLEEREVLAEARRAGNLAEVARLQTAMKARRTATLDQIATLFVAPEPERHIRLLAIKMHLILLRYIERYLEECDSALDDED